MATKNILYSIPSLRQSFGGLRQYSINLLNSLARLPDVYQIYVYHNDGDPLVTEIIESNSRLILVTATTEKKIQHRIIVKVLQLLKIISWDLFDFSIEYSFVTTQLHLIKKHNIHLIHCPFQSLPIVKGNVKLLTTIHDVQELHFPEYFSPETRKERAIKYMDCIDRADAIFVSYEHVKKDIIKYFQKEESKIFVAFLNMKDHWVNKYIGSSNQKKTVETFERFLLYPANFWEHKNHLKLLEAIVLLREKRGEIVNLVFTGDFSKPYGQELTEVVQKFGLKGQVELLGVVDESRLYSLYLQATGTVVPTLYEAGSFPLMESILIGIPVICSNVTSLPDTIGDKRFVFDPLNVEEMAELIFKIWTDETFRSLCGDNSKAQRNRLLETTIMDVLNECYSQLLLSA